VSKILIGWSLGTGIGHLTNLKPVAAELIRRGHEISFVTKGPIESERLLGELPIRFLQAPIFYGRLQRQISNPSTMPQFWHNDGFGHPEVLGALTRSWNSLIELVEPDLVLCDHSPVALLALRSRPEIRRVVFGVGLLCPPDEHPMPSFGGDGPSPPPHRALLDEERVLWTCNQVLDRFHCKKLERVGQLSGEADDTLLTTYSEIDPFGPRAESLYCGVWGIEGGERVQWLTEKPRAIVYLRDTPALSETLAGLAAAGVEAVMYVAQPSARAKEAADRHGVRMTSLLDFSRLAEADLVVTHGTHAATIQPLLQGVPVLMLPLNRETSMIGAAVERLGAGRRVSQVEAGTVATEAGSLLGDRSFRSAAETFQSRYGKTSDAVRVAAACDRIDALL